MASFAEHCSLPFADDWYHVIPFEDEDHYSEIRITTPASKLPRLMEVEGNLYHAMEQYFHTFDSVRSEVAADIVHAFTTSTDFSMFCQVDFPHALETGGAELGISSPRQDAAGIDGFFNMLVETYIRPGFVPTPEECQKIGKSLVDNVSPETLFLLATNAPQIGSDITALDTGGEDMYINPCRFFMQYRTQEAANMFDGIRLRDGEYLQTYLFSDWVAENTKPYEIETIDLSSPSLPFSRLTT